MRTTSFRLIPVLIFLCCPRWRWPWAIIVPRAKRLIVLPDRCMTAPRRNACRTRAAASATRQNQLCVPSREERRVPCGAEPAGFAENGNTAEAWNYRGFATRKLGRTDEGIGYYQRALAIAPDYAKAREYLGEAWMVKGRPDLAKEQLKVIAGICGQSCEEYRDLQAAINGHPES